MSRQNTSPAQRHARRMGCRERRLPLSLPLALIFLLALLTARTADRRCWIPPGPDSGILLVGRHRLLR